MPRFFSFSTMIGLSFLLVGVVSGCGETGDGYSGPRGKVTGTITLDDKPLPSGCQVVFISEKGYTAIGTIADGGNYALAYPHGDIPAVEYQVQLAAPASTATPNSDPVKMAENVTLSKKGSGEKDDSPFPARYLSTSSSKMSFTVKEGENKADFALTGK